MSKILVDTIDTRSGTSTLTLGSSNAGTIALGSGDVQSNFLYPAFEAHSATDQTISDNTYTKVTLGTEVLDTDGKFASNRFTPTIAGKYFVYGSARLQTDDSQMRLGSTAIYKNGSIYAERTIDFRGNNGLQMSVDISTTIDMDSDDYVELFAKIYKGGGSNIRIESDSKSTNFGAYRIIGA